MRQLLPVAALLLCISAFGQTVSIATLNTPYTQNFDGLASTGTANSVLPQGWYFFETGTGANTTYAADNGGLNSGNTYSYGSTGSTERALGSLLSGSVTPTLGVGFTNNTGTTITSLLISYTGEMWRAGVTSRTTPDTLNFQFSLDATDLVSGNWTNVDPLDLFSPRLGVAAGALDGNLAINRTAIQYTLTGLSIAPGATFYLRWNEFNISSSDDGLAVDDFSLTAQPGELQACVAPAAQATALLGSAITQTSLTVSWTDANPKPDKYVVTMGATANVPAGPQNGVSYNVGDALANGTVVYKGNGNSFPLTGLTAGTTYWFYVWPVNDLCAGGPLYNTLSPLRGSLKTADAPVCVAPTQPPTALVLTPGFTAVSGGFAASPDADSYLVVYSTTSNPGFTPANGTSYTPGQSTSGVVVAKYGTGTSFTAGTLNPATQYYFFVYGMQSQGCTGGPLYLTTALTGNTTTLTLENDIPAGFYDTASGKSCAPLKSALKWRTSVDINKNPVVPKTYTELWAQYLISDVKPREVGTGSAQVIWDIYSDNPTGPDPYNFTPGPVASGGQQDNGTEVNAEGVLYNREHSVPLSWFGGNTSDPGPATDYIHIFPTDKWVNALRANFIFGEITNPVTTTLNGSKYGPNAFAGLSGEAFEPIAEYKGDLARAFLYFVTRYEDQMPGWTGGTGGSQAFDPNTWPSVDLPYLRLMIKWHKQDPVSPRELERNKAAYQYQGNRNPFVDHPEYVEQIWSDGCGLALPAYLLSFTGTLQGTQVVLRWEPGDEAGLKSYSIERSVNGRDFKALGEVAAKRLSQYQFTDGTDIPGGQRFFYRLRLNQKDGTYKYSDVFTLHVPLNNRFQVYPNPAVSSVNLQLGAARFTGMVSITDMAGRVVQSHKLSQASGVVTLPVQHLQSGQYIIRLQAEGAKGWTSTQPLRVLH